MDRGLVEAAQRGDREAYADLVRAAWDRLFAIAQRILRDVDRTEDALQEALVIAWRDLPGLRDPDRFDAWLHRLVVRSCIAEAVRAPAHVANLHVLPVDVAATSDDYLCVADRDQLERGFRRLPPEQRALLVLRHYAGLEPAEIADAARHPRRHRPLPTPSCPPRDARRPRGGRPHGRRRRPQHEPRARHRARPRRLAPARPDGHAGPPLRRRARADRTSAPAAPRPAPAEDHDHAPRHHRRGRCRDHHRRRSGDRPARTAVHHGRRRADRAGTDGRSRAERDGGPDHVAGRSRVRPSSRAAVPLDRRTPPAPVAERRRRGVDAPLARADRDLHERRPERTPLCVVSEHAGAG